ncbi:MAG: 2-oxoacid:acceptor oxidoreductase family protein [Candidatus Eisenbacteria bacterium]|nr:2-oxoacid:acceptor oxidoreductase family protein [Candidatus Eisenbacteria bacterium]
MERTEIRITGFGGQGAVLIGYIIGRAWSVHAGGHSTMIQSFGPEARGSTCSATLVLSDEEVLYPYVRRTDVLVALSSDGCSKYLAELEDDGMLVYESDLVDPVVAPGQAARGIPSTRIAEGLGRRLVGNMVMLGFFAATTGLVPLDAMREALRLSVPSGTEELNLKAFETGVRYADAPAGIPAEPGAAR